MRTKFTPHSRCSQRQHG